MVLLFQMLLWMCNIIIYGCASSNMTSDMVQEALQYSVKKSRHV